MANEFQWDVALEGYEWIDCMSAVHRQHADRFRGLVEKKEQVFSGILYAPLSNPALFRVFADTPPTEEGVVQFADRWGKLGNTPMIGSAAPLSRRQRGERFAYWVQAISEMRQAVWIWNRLSSKLRDMQMELQQRVWWEEDDQGSRVMYDSHPELPKAQTWTTDGYARILTVIASDGNTTAFQRNELAGPARSLLCRFINQRLKGKVNSVIVPDEWPEKRTTILVKAHLVQVPNDLETCLWLQLAQAIDNRREQRKCPGCGLWFEIRVKDRGKESDRWARSDRRFCSEACRKKAHRDKQLKALELHAAGMSPKDIAKEIGSEVVQVRKWVKTFGR
jgi:flavoprotein